MTEPYVLVIGAATVDMKGWATEPLQRSTSMPGVIRTSVGGVARNIAENLARLGVETKLLTAVGDDRPGRGIVTDATEAGIDASHILTVPDATTGYYLAIRDRHGELAYAVDDLRIATHIRPNYVNKHRRLFREAGMVVLDANVPSATLKTIFRLAEQYNVPVCADPTTTSLAHRFCPYLDRLLLVTPNVQEAVAMCHIPIPARDLEADIAAAKHLVSMGVKIAVITLAERGVCYATTEESGYVPAVQTEVVDPTGAGDALTAAVVFALLNEIPVSEAVQLGGSAASLTIASDQTIVPDLTLESLYDNLNP